MLSFIHLSDIHFHKYSGDKYDVDSDLRNEIIRDIHLEYPKYINSATGILICGDIAFSGQSKEYQVAKEFLADILSDLGLKETDVFIVFLVIMMWIKAYLKKNQRSIIRKKC